MNKTAVAIIGSGNIATDLLIKALRSESVLPRWMVGIDPASAGLRRARSLGLQTSACGLDDALPGLLEDGVAIALDATSAAAHRRHSPVLLNAGVHLIDLTPAAMGPFCVPSVTPPTMVNSGPLELNMVSCGGQAAIPIVAAISGVQAVSYAEAVATVASRSIGPGTRQNIDEFTRTTAAGIEQLGGVPRGKAIVVINPAEPPILMRNTVHCLTADAPDQAAIARAVEERVAQVQAYVPGYRLTSEPLFEGRRCSVFLEVEGLGDYLPVYAGNLDIMTAAALRSAELLASALQGGGIAGGGQP